MKALIHLEGRKVKDGKIDLKNVPLYNGDLSENKLLCSLTPKGYYSTKPIYVDFATIDRVVNVGGGKCTIINGKLDGNGKKYMEITEEEYNYLLDNYTNKGKIFQTAEQRYRTNKAVGDLAWCASMKDPYDRG